MKPLLTRLILCCILGLTSCASVDSHPKTDTWADLFDADLSDAVYPAGIWTTENGVLTASEDQVIWTQQEYDNFVLDLEFMTDSGTNSGVIVYCSDRDNWIPNSLEIQIADDFNEKWAQSAKTWQCAAIFGRLAASESRVKEPGAWNRMTVTCRDHMISVVLNGKQVTEMDMTLWTEAKTNPDGSEIPSWLSKPAAELATHGYIGMQGKHAGAPIFFRHLKIKEL